MNENNGIKNSINNLKIDIKLINKTLENLSRTIEKLEQLNASVIELNEKLKAFDKRLDETEKFVEALKMNMQTCCPIHEQTIKTITDEIRYLKNGIRDISTKHDQDLDKIELGIKDEFRFRDKVLVGLGSTLFVQILILILTLVFKKF